VQQAPASSRVVHEVRGHLHGRDRRITWAAPPDSIICKTCESQSSGAAHIHANKSGITFWVGFGLLDCFQRLAPVTDVCTADWHCWTSQLAKGKIFGYWSVQMAQVGEVDEIMFANLANAACSSSLGCCSRAVKVPSSILTSLPRLPDGTQRF
jgi:hypothetical protein